MDSREISGDLSSEQQNLEICVDNRPSDYEYASLSEHVYGGQNLKPGDTLPDNAQWKVHAVQSGGCSYFSAIYINDETQQVVLAYRGTDSLLAIWEDIQGIVCNALSTQKKEAFYFVEESINLVKAKNNQNEPYRLSFTGHSLGAFLAELSVFYALKDYVFKDVNAVTFESPGSKNSMEEMQSNHQPVDLRRLDIVGYVSYPNLINTWNKHVGTLYQISPNLNEITTNLIHWIFRTNHTKQAHAMKGILKLFKESNNHFPSRLYMYDWPLFSQRSTFFEYFEKREGHYVLKEKYKTRQQFSLIYECHYCYDESLSGWSRLPLRHFSSRFQDFLKAFYKYKFLIARDENACARLVERWNQFTIPEHISQYLLKYRLEKDSRGIERVDLDTKEFDEDQARAFRYELSSWLKAEGHRISELFTLPQDTSQTLLPSVKPVVKLLTAIIAPQVELAQGGEFEDISVSGVDIEIPEDTDEQNIRYLERLSNAVLSRTSKIETYGIAPDAKIGGPIRMKGVKIQGVKFNVSTRQPVSTVVSNPRPAS